MLLETHEQKDQSITDQTIAHFEAMSPDLKSYGLAASYVRGFFEKMSMEGAFDLDSYEKAGAEIFYHLAKEILGPIAVAFTHFSLKHSEGRVVFPARDATPYYIIAQKLVEAKPQVYPVSGSSLANPFFNRKLWGIDDELDTGKVLKMGTPTAKRFLEEEIGFGQMLTFIEQGAWGSMADAIKTHHPDQSFQLLFFFSHLPDNVFGFTNQFGFKEGDLETVSDTFEALPKQYLRPTNLIIDDEDKIHVDLASREIESPLIQSWAQAVFYGFGDAAQDFLFGKKINPKEELEKILTLSQKAKDTGEFTGVLPFHTMTWTEGEKWKANWPWEKIPPLGVKI